MDTNYEKRVRKYERMGMTRSDAQGVVDAEDMKAGRGYVPPMKLHHVKEHRPDPMGEPTYVIHTLKAERDRLLAQVGELRAALEALMADDANSAIQDAKDRLFYLAPEIPAAANAAIYRWKLASRAAPSGGARPCGDGVCLVAEARGEHLRCQGKCAYDDRQALSNTKG